MSAHLPSAVATPPNMYRHASVVPRLTAVEVRSTDMADVELELPDRIDTQIKRFIEQGDFLNCNRLIEELLMMELKSCEGREDVEEPFDDEFARRAFAKQEDPALGDADSDEMT